jgi:hypothetical protein
MMAVGLLLAIYGGQDLLGDRRLVGISTTRPRDAAFITSLATGAGGLLLGYPVLSALALAAVAASSVGVWRTVRRKTGTVTQLAAGLAIPAAMLASGGTWPTTDGGRLGNLVRDLPYPLVHDRPLANLLLAGGCAVFLLQTTNELVRLALSSAGATTPGQPAPFRGGRSIGSLERLLIFGFSIAGAPAVAAVIATAKGIVRFPEFRDGGRDMDPAVEYFLVGSLTSWAIAFALAALFLD